MTEEFFCENWVGEDRGLEGDECGKPATEAYRFPDGSMIHLCAPCWDEWVADEEADLAEAGRDTPLGRNILDCLILNGVVSK